MDPDPYQQELTPLLDAMSPAARFMVKAMLDEEGNHSINLDPDDYRQAMTFFRSALDLALEHEDNGLADRVRRCRRTAGGLPFARRHVEGCSKPVCETGLGSSDGDSSLR